MGQPNSSKVVFLDLETGGLKPEAPILQIAAVAINSDWKEVGVFDAKIRVDPAACEPAALEINHYDQAIWDRDGRDELTVITAFKRFLDGHATSRLVSKRSGRPYIVARAAGHNVVAFDLEWLSRAFTRHQTFFPVHRADVLDTLQGAAWYFERQQDGRRPESFTLTSIAKFFGLDTSGVHDALFDVRLAIQIARRFLS